MAFCAMKYLGIMILLKLMPAHLKRGGGEIPMLSAKTPTKVIKLNCLFKELKSMNNLNLDEQKIKEGIQNESLKKEEKTSDKTYNIDGYKVLFTFKDTGLTLSDIVESYIEEKLFIF